MFAKLTAWLFPRVTPTNVITIDKRKLHFNYGYLSGLHPDAQIFPVVSGNAYGHGLEQILSIYKKIPVPYLVTDSINDVNMICAHSRHKVLFSVETLPSNYRFFDFARVTPCVGSIEVLEALLQMKIKKNIHLVINTGKGAQGFASDQLTQALHLLKTHQYKQYTHLEGVMSHVQSADDPGKNHIMTQIETFKSMYHRIVDAGFLPYYKHMGDSACMLKVDDDFFNAWRPGLALYGYNPLHSSDTFYKKGQKLKPAMTLTSRVIAVHSSDQPTKMIEVHCGFGDGMRNTGANQYVAELHGKIVHQTGRVRLHSSTFLVDQAMDVSPGDKITLISPQSPHTQVFARSQAASTTQEEVLCSLNPMIKRTVIIS